MVGAGRGLRYCGDSEFWTDSQPKQVIQWKNFYEIIVVVMPDADTQLVHRLLSFIDKHDWQKMYRGFAQVAREHMLDRGGFFNFHFLVVDEHANKSLKTLKNCFVKTLNDSQIVVIDMQGNRHAHALADITSVEKLQGIRVAAAEVEPVEG